MIYELRQYALAPGGMPEMHRRMEEELQPIFRRLDFNDMVGAWEAVSGPATPVYIWMLAWPDYQARAEAWRAFYPEWGAHRARTPAPDFTRDGFVTMMEPCADARFNFSSSPDAVDELWLYRFRFQAGVASKQATLAAETAALEAAGASLFGGFDFVFGTIPQSAMFVSWPNAEARRVGLPRYETNPELATVRTSNTGVPYCGMVDSVDRYLLERAPYSRSPGNNAQ